MRTHTQSMKQIEAGIYSGDPDIEFNMQLLSGTAQSLVDNMAGMSDGEEVEEEIMDDDDKGEKKKENRWLD